MWKELLEDCHREEGSGRSDKLKYFCEKAARDLKRKGFGKADVVKYFC